MGSRFGVWLGFLTLSLGVAAQTTNGTGGGAEVSVRDVEFQRVQDAGGNEWWEATVVVNVDGRGGGIGRFADRVRVGFNVAFQRPIEGRPLEFDRAAVVAASLEAGRQTFRFYLPPAIVRRDRITSDARFWTVDLSVDGREAEPDANQISAAFSSAGAVANFRDQHGRAAPANDGVLIPRHLSPWATNQTDADPVVIQPSGSGVQR